MHYFKPYLLRKQADTGFGPYMPYDPTTPMGVIQRTFDEDLQQGKRQADEEAKQLQQHNERNRIFQQLQRQRLNNISMTSPVSPDVQKWNTGKQSISQDGQLNTTNGTVTFRFHSGSPNEDYNAHSIVIDRFMSPALMNYPKIWRGVINNSLTNRDVLNLKANSKDYADKLNEHYGKITRDEQIAAGMRIPSLGERNAWLNQKAITPDVVPANYRNAFFYSGTGKIKVFDAPDNRHLNNWYSVRYNAGYPSSHGFESLTTDNSDLAFGEDYAHEHNHAATLVNNYLSSGIRSVQGRYKDPSFKKVNPAINTNFINKYTKQGLAVPFFQTFSGTLDRPFSEEDAAGRYTVIPNVPDGWTAEQFAAAGGDAFPADPNAWAMNVNGFTRLGEKPVQYMDPSKGHAYIYKPNEIRQAMSALNQGQYGLQEEMRSNPQKYLQAGLKQKDIDEFLALPAFIRGPNKRKLYAQRMEFYARHPEFQALIGMENSRAIDTYFTLERESRNPNAPESWRRTHKAWLDFMGDNAWIARNNYSNTGMGRYMTNTTIG